MPHKQPKEVSLFSLAKSDPSLSLVKASMAQNDGLLPFFIHPHYQTYSESSTPRTGKRRVMRKLHLLEAGAVPEPRLNLDESPDTVLSEMAYLLRLWRFLRQTDAGVLAVGECVPYLAATIDLFRRMGYRGDILHYSTRLSGPQPADGEGSWLELADVIRLLEPRTVVVGGQLSQASVEEPGCVPTFVQSVSASLDSKQTRFVFSPIVYPFWRNSSMIDKR